MTLTCRWRRYAVDG